MEDSSSPTVDGGGEDILTAGQRVHDNSPEFDTSQDAHLAKQLLDEFKRHGPRKPGPPPGFRPVNHDIRQPPVVNQIPSFGGPSYYNPAQQSPWQWQVSSKWKVLKSEFIFWKLIYSSVKLKVVITNIYCSGPLPERLARSCSTTMARFSRVSATRVSATSATTMGTIQLR